MATMFLTQKIVDTLVCRTAGKRLTVFDRRCRGLVLEVRASGRKSYFLRYKDTRCVTRQPKLCDAESVSLKQAKALAESYKSKMLMGEDPFRKKAVLSQVPTFARFIEDQYMPHIKAHKRSWTTDVSILKNHLLPRFADKRLDQISRKDIARMHLERRAGGAAAGSANRLLIMMRYIFNLALRWQVPGVEENPSKNLPLLPDNNKRERYLSQEEVRWLYEAVAASENPMLQHIVPMLILTGARKREVLDARWEDLDLERRQWRIPTTKLGMPRHVPISDGVLCLLRELPRTTGVPYVFANPATGKPFVSVFYSWNTARIRAGLPQLRVHDLRHSFASFLVNAGRSLYEVQKILGHTQIQTTQRYAHLAPQTLLDASNVATLAVGEAMGVRSQPAAERSAD
jgi:integrase